MRAAGGPGEQPAAAARPQQPSELYEAQERAVLQEYHFILKKILDRVQKKTAADVDATAAARATASAALAAVPGAYLNLNAIAFYIKGMPRTQHSLSIQ